MSQFGTHISNKCDKAAVWLLSADPEKYPCFPSLEGRQDAVVTTQGQGSRWHVCGYA